MVFKERSHYIQKSTASLLILSDVVQRTRKSLFAFTCILLHLNQSFGMDI